VSQSMVQNSELVAAVFCKAAVGQQFFSVSKSKKFVGKLPCLSSSYSCLETPSEPDNPAPLQSLFGLTADG